MWDFFVALSARVLGEKVDRFREREDGYVAGKDDGNGGHGNEERLDVVCNAFRGGRACEEGEAEIDKDKVLRELCERRENVFGRALRPTRHGVICVMFESDATEQQRDDARHGEAGRKEVASISTECDKARLDGGVEAEGGVFQYQRHGEAETDA